MRYELRKWQEVNVGATNTKHGAFMFILYGVGVIRCKVTVSVLVAWTGGNAHSILRRIWRYGSRRMRRYKAQQAFADRATRSLQRKLLTEMVGFLFIMHCVRMHPLALLSSC